MAGSITAPHRHIRIQGHLLDSGLINQALDRIVEGGGCFQVLDFALGQQRHIPSSATIRVSAPDAEVLADLMVQLIDLGAESVEAEERDASLAVVEGDGVAPDDFYVSTIYPADVRLDSRWWPVSGQRMDSALVVHPCPNSAEAAARVECRLLRDLRDGEQVVVGVEGLRSQRRPLSREGRESDVAFMAAGVCSERRAGIIHACVSRGVPFVLAGSIRDDGPLPDTEMDLIAA